jgi:5-methylthioadenosine/S-adenosylhomocysteine deaminase
MTESKSGAPAMGPQWCDTIISHGHVLTLDEASTGFIDGAIAITHGRIVAVGDAADVTDVYQAARTIDATGKVVLPGMINAHMHLPWSVLRNRVPFAGLFGEGHNDWLTDTLFPRWAWLNAEREYVSTLLACCESLKLGVTLIADGGSMEHPDACAEAFRACGVRGVVAGRIYDRPLWGRDYSQTGLRTPSTAEALARVEDVVVTHHGGARSRVQAFASVIGADTCTDELIVGAKQIADRYDVRLDFHQSVQRHQIEDHQRRHGYRDDPMCHLARIGALGENVRLLETHWVDQEGIDQLANHRSSVVTCDPLYLTIDWPDAPTPMVEMIERGVNVTIGTDDPAMTDVFRFAQMTAAIHRRSEAEMFQLCTINAARSMGLEQVVGSIEAGKEADLAIWGTAGLEWEPRPASLVGFFKLSASAVSVDTVLVGGDVVVEDGVLMHVDEQELRERANRMAQEYPQ